MKWQGKIDFAKPATINGKPHGIEHVSSFDSLTFSSEDVGRTIHDESTGRLWFGSPSGWKELTPGGVGDHVHDDIYYKTELDGMFEGYNGAKQTVDWTNVINKPSTFNPSTHSHTGTEVTFDDTNSSLGVTTVQEAIDEIATSSGGASIPVTGVLYVDNNRVDSYVEDGSFLTPYKTISAAISNLGSKNIIFLKQGTYSENITLPANVELISDGTSWYNGSIVVGDGSGGTTRLENLTITGQLTINVGTDNTCKISSVYVHNSGFVVLQSGNLEGDLAVDTTTTNPAIEVQDGSFYSNGQRFTSAGTNTILQTGGRVILSMSEVIGSSAGSLIDSTGGTLILESSQVINTGGGLAVSVSNSGNAMNPNLFADIVHSGGVEVNACLLISEGIVGDVPTTLNGGVVVYRGANQITFDDTNTSLGVANTQDAIESVFNIASVAVIPQTSGIPSDSPQVGTARFDPSDGSLYIYDGTQWVVK